MTLIVLIIVILFGVAYYLTSGFTTTDQSAAVGNSWAKGIRVNVSDPSLYNEETGKKYENSYENFDSTKGPFGEITQKFNGQVGTIMDGPISYNGVSYMRIRWSDGTGWIRQGALYPYPSSTGYIPAINPNQTTTAY